LETATKGKVMRAHAVSLLYEKGAVTHVPGLHALESELLGFSDDWDRGRDGARPIGRGGLGARTAAGDQARDNGLANQYGREHDEGPAAICYHPDARGVCRNILSWVSLLAETARPMT